MVGKLEKRIRPLVNALKSGNTKKYMQLANKFTKNFPDIKGKLQQMHSKGIECIAKKHQISKVVVLLHMVSKLILLDLHQIDEESLDMVSSACRIISESFETTGTDVPKELGPAIVKDIIKGLQFLETTYSNMQWTAVGDCYLKLGFMLQKFQRPEESNKELKLGIAWLKLYSDEYTVNCDTMFGSIYAILGCNYLKLHLYSDAIAWFEKAKTTYMKSYELNDSEKLEEVEKCDFGINACTLMKIKEEKRSTNITDAFKKIDGLKKSIINLKQTEYEHDLTILFNDLKKSEVLVIICNKAEEYFDKKDFLKCFILSNMSIMLVFEDKNIKLENMKVVEACIAWMGNAFGSYVEYSMCESSSLFSKFFLPALNKVLIKLLTLQSPKLQCLKLIAICHKSIGDWHMKHKLFQKSICSFDEGIKVLDQPGVKEIATTWRIYGVLKHTEAVAYFELHNYIKAMTLLLEAIDSIKLSNTDWESEDEKAEAIKETVIALGEVCRQCIP